MYLQIKFLSVAGLNSDEKFEIWKKNLDETGDYEQTKNDTLDSMFVQSLNISNDCTMIAI